MSVRRESPRDAIRNWLAHTEQPSEAGEIKLTRDEGRDGQKSRSRHRHRRGRSRSRHEAHDVSLQGLNSNTQHKAKINERSTRLEANDGSGPAKRLGLHPPFQAMDLKQLDDEKRLDLAGTTRYRKRKRSSSATSFLEPAVVDDPVETGNDVRDGDAIRRSASRNVGHKDEMESRSICSASSLSSPSPVKPAKTYERRARRKTKEDRYELKEDTKAKKERAKRKNASKKETSGKKQKRSKKSGAALLHSFMAKNVTSNRLTLRPTANLGLFTRGRASSPIRRRGLPDLSFSEMTFLNTRGKLDEPLKDTNRKKTSRKSKAENLDDEISRFFASTRAPLTERDPNISRHNIEQAPLQQANSRHTRDARYSSVERSSVPAVKLPERPFLGFCKRRPCPPSPKELREDVGIGAFRTRKQPHSEHSRSTTYYTWSQSPELGQRRPKQQVEHDLAVEGFEESPDRGRAGMSPRKAGSSQPNIHHMSCCEKCSTRISDNGLNHSRITQDGDPIDANGREKLDISTNAVDCRRGLEKTPIRVHANHENLIRSRNSPSIVPATESSNTLLPANPQMALQTNRLDKSIGENESFTEVLDALFENIQAEIPLLPTTNRPAQEVIGEDFIVHQPAYQAPSPSSNRHQGIPTTHSFGHTQQAIKGQIEPTQTVAESQYSPPYTKEIAVKHPQQAFTGNGTTYPPKIFAPLPSQAHISGYGRPATIYGQQFQFKDSGENVPHIQNKDNIRISRSQGSRSLTARPYGTPVSLESRPSRGPEGVQSNNREPSQRGDWHYNDQVHKQDVTGDIFEGQAARGDYTLGRSEPLDVDTQNNFHYGPYAPFTHHEDIDILKKSSFESHRSRPATNCSHSPSFIGDLALPYQAQKNLSSVHRPVTARNSRGDQSPRITNLSPRESARIFDHRTGPTVRGSSRGEQGFGARQDEDWGPAGFWKPNRLY